MLTVIQGQLEERRSIHASLKKRRLSLFARARQLFQEVCDRKPFAVVIRFFHQFFAFLRDILTQQTLENGMAVFLKFSKQQHALLQ
jgi:hypothetical protein